jgi:hypothetical protein
MNTIRNAVVHKSHVAIDKFNTLVRDKKLTLPQNFTPADFLLATKPGLLTRTYLHHYYNKLRVVANKIVPS